jgi:hypothetical protein
MFKKLRIIRPDPQKAHVTHFELARLLLKKGDAAQAAAEGEKALGLSGGGCDGWAIHYMLIRAWQ